jgi:uncharacterized iron-regulated protein
MNTQIIVMFLAKIQPHYFTAFLIVLSLVACSHSPAPEHTDTPTTHTIKLATFYDYQLYSSDNQEILNVSRLAKQLATAEVIFIGEYHSHSASHLLQAQLLNSLYNNNPNLVLSLEQFTRDKQSLVDAYLKNEIGEQTLLKQGDAWNNYTSDYRPLVEFAKANTLPVIAANTPLSIVRCIAKEGADVINRFDAETRAWVADDVTSSSEQYLEKFAQAMGHHGGGKKTGPVTKTNSFYAQLSRDNTMAESIYRALKANPNSQVIHMNGAFHSDYGLGTVDALKRLNPDLNIAVISPVFENDTMDWQKGDYLYTIKAMPTRYIKKENRDHAIQSMMATRKNNQCVL